MCALLVAVLAVQPAAGDGKGKGNANGKAKHDNAPAAAAPAGAGDGAPGGPPAPAAAPAPDPAPAPAQSNGPKPGNAPATGATGKGKASAKSKAAGKHRAKSRSAQKGAPPPQAQAPASPGNSPSAGHGPPAKHGAPVDEVPAAGREERDPGTPPQMSEAPGEKREARDAPAAQDGAPPRDAGVTPDTARGAPGSGNIGVPASPSAEAPAVTAVVPPPAAAPAGPPGTQEPGSGAVAVPVQGSGSAPPLNGDLRGNGLNSTLRQPPQASAITGPSPLTQTGGAIPASAIEIPLVTPATEAITRVREAGPSQTSGPRPRRGDTVAPLQGVASAGASDSSVGAVLVSWAKYALAVLVLLVLALGVNSIVAAARTRRLERQRERLMEDIGLLQAALLPAVPARLGALLTTVAYRPADGPAAGGDFYDAFPLPDGRVGLLLGDVSGHGRQALAKTTLVRFTVRAHLEAGLSPREAVAIAGRSLDGRLSDDFATVIAAIHDPAMGTLTYASAGHPPPIVVGPARHHPVTVSSAPPIGVGFPTGQRQTVLPMPEGVSVMIYSDGLLEARIDGVPIGPERLAAWLDEFGPDGTAKAVLDRVVENADRVPDDLAAVLLHASPGASAPAARIEQLKLDVLDMDGPDLDGFLRAAGVSEVDRLIAGRRVSELLATTSGVIVDVRTGEHPMVSVAPIGDDTAVATRPSARAR